MKKLMKQAQQMQSEMQKKQAELSQKIFEANAGGGMVTAKVNGKHELLSLKIDPTIVSADDVEMMQDLVVAAVNEAFRQVEESMKESMSGMLGGLGGLGNLL
ncbi:MAG: YbaB/EbfC family nucleoid-associated protein [Pseudomonadota bacterium]